MGAKQSMTRRVAFLSVVAVLLLAGLGIRAALRVPVAPVSQPAPAPDASVGLRGGTIVLRQHGVAQAEVRAGRVEVSRDLRFAHLTEAVRAVLYDRGKVTFTVQAAEVVLDRRTNDLQIRGPVEIGTPAGDHLLAPEAQWIQARHQLIFPRGVRITTGENEISAQRLVVDTQRQTFALAGDVDVAFRFPGTLP